MSTVLIDAEQPEKKVRTATQKELDAIRTTQNAFPATTSFLLMGETGMGKTYALGTAPAPIFIDSFDQRGPETLRKLMGSGRVVADRRWEYDDPKNPSVVDKWEQTFFNRYRNGFFNNIGTYCIDSASGLLRSIMYRGLKKEGRAGGVPQQNDWLPQMTVFENIMNVVTALPCHVVVTFHLDMKEDAATGQLIFRPMITGKLAVRIPLMFSEIYVAIASTTSKGTEYSFLTQSTGRYMARTRMGQDGLFAQREVPNIQELLKRADRAWEDKEL